MLKKDSILVGIGVGLVVPFVGYALLLELYDQLAAGGVISDIGLSESFRKRTIALLALCLNLIPFILYNRRWYHNTMRGIVFPTVLYATLWFIYFGSKLI